MLKPNTSLPNGVTYPDNAYLYYAPNTDHSLVSSNALDLDENSYRALLAFYLSIINNRERPKFVWWVEKDTTETNISKRAFRIRLDCITKPKEVLLWQATNKKTRDFRLSTIGLGWSSSKLKPFCEECGGDPGYDPEAIIDDTTTNQKSYSIDFEGMDSAKAILAKIQNSNEQKILCLEGTPQQMGIQYGVMMKDEISKLIQEENSLLLTPEEEQSVSSLKKGMPALWTEIIQGIAEGSGIPLEQLLKAHIEWWKSGNIVNSIDGSSILSVISNGNNKSNPLLLTMWKPVDQEPFITIDPVGLFVMNLVIKNTGETIATLNDSMEQLADNINKTQFILNWLNTPITINRIAEQNASDIDLLYAYRNNLYGIVLDGVNLKSVNIPDDIHSVNGNWVAKFTPSNNTISFPSSDNTDNTFTLSSIFNTLNSTVIAENNSQTTIQQNTSIQILKTNATTVAKSYIEAEGEGEPPCICEFDNNEIIPYVGTVEVPREGWTAFFIQIRFPGPEPYIPELKDLDYVFSTRVVIVPDTYPN